MKKIYARIFLHQYKLMLCKNILILRGRGKEREKKKQARLLFPSANSPRLGQAKAQSHNSIWVTCQEHQLHPGLH